MATLGLSPSNKSLTRLYKKDCRSFQTLQRQLTNGSINVTSENFPVVNTDIKQPRVSFSVKTRGRWSLIEAFCDHAPPADQKTISEDPNIRRRRSKLSGLRVDLHKTSSEPKSEGRQRRDEKCFLKLSSAKKLQRATVRRRQNLRDIIVSDLEDEWEDWETDEEDNSEPFYPSFIEEGWQKMEEDLGDFEEVDEDEDFVEVAAVKTLSSTEGLHDSTSISASLVRPAAVDLSSVALRRRFGSTLVDGPRCPRLFAVDISGAVRQRRGREVEDRPLEAYVVFEAVGDRLALRLNCSADGEISLPTLHDGDSLEELLEVCVDGCASRLRSERLPDVHERLWMTSARVPLAGGGGEEISLLGDVVAAPVCRPASHCCLCFAALSPGAFSALSCAHACCESCWRRYLLAEMSSGRPDLHCPSFGCRTSVDFASRLRYVSVDALREHQRLLLSRPDVLCCPSCQHPVLVSDLEQLRDFSSSVEVVCSCGFAFCPLCLHEAHWPASCALLQRLERRRPRWTRDRLQWLTSLLTNIKEMPALVVHTRPCPSCGTNWTKDGGCSHMSCPVCSTEFCWRCGNVFTRFCSHSHCRPKRITKLVFAPEVPPVLVYLVQLRQVADNVSLTKLRSRYRRLLQRAVPDSSQLPHLLSALADTARAAEFAGLIAVGCEDEQLVSDARRLQRLSGKASAALGGLSAVENERSRGEAVRRLTACQQEAVEVVRRMKARPPVEEEWRVEELMNTFSPCKNDED